MWLNNDNANDSFKNSNLIICSYVSMSGWGYANVFCALLWPLIHFDSKPQSGQSGLGQRARRLEKDMKKWMVWAKTGWSNRSMSGLSGTDHWDFTLPGSAGLNILLHPLCHLISESWICHLIQFMDMEAV